MIQWKRGKLSDSTDTYQLVHTRLKTNTLIDLPLSGERFQKKIQLYFSNTGLAQPKMCQFVLSTKKTSDEKWSNTEVEYDFSNNGEKSFIHNSFVNSASTPFNSDFFLIMNIAMGGTLGGAIDGEFIQDSMEVDYVRVYQ